MADQVGAVAMIGLALVVWRVRPYNLANQVFLGLVIAWAGGLVVTNLWDLHDPWIWPYEPWVVIVSTTRIVAAGLTIAFAVLFPTRLTRREWRRLGRTRHVAWAIPVAFLTYTSTWLAIVVWTWDWSAQGTLDLPVGLAEFIVAFAVNALAASWLFVSALLAVRLQSSSPSSATFKTAWIMGLAVLVYPLFVNGFQLAQAARLGGPPLRALGAVGWAAIELMVVVPWFIAGAGQGGAPARRVGLSALAIFLAGMLYYSLTDGADAGIGGASRLAAVALLAYGILKAQLFDIDLKLKWTLKRGTAVGALAAVFFVVKESVEFLLPLEGMLPSLAGAALVTLLALPAWRMAERVTDRLMPRIVDTSEYRTIRKQDVYRAALEVLSADRMVEARQRSVLARLQEQLGLDAVSAQRIELELLDAREAG